ncbi:thioredoxin family protein [Arcicella sp. LKC2W]|uniref:thioredoxin family protein n=1 Tax=Arcicella sp. LKC2W TaxID=2984198 RepID=UPI002B1FB0BD|nr:thioredoxin family protein [Arcicella sp. LKC2W]MEA5461308.1 thioredoxin family protein [Arcicella sp. LKC2W]
MLKNITLFTILLFTQTLNAQTKGISFVKTGLKSAFEIAKKQNKPVFIEIYANGCPHCENFKKTFDTNPKVGAYYNQRFVSYQVEVNSAEGRALRQKHNIYVVATPTMSFWDKDENLLHIQPAGDEQNNEAYLKTLADRAIDPTKNTASYKGYFEQGVQEDNFLIEYAYMCRMICDTTYNIAAMNTYAKKQEAAGFTSPSNFLVLQKVVLDDENTLFKHVVNNLDSYYAKYGKKEVVSTVENIVMYSLYCSRASNYSLEKLATMKDNLRKIGIDKQSIAGRFLLIETRALFKANQAAKAIEVIDEFYKGVKTIDKKDAEFIEKYVRGYVQDNTQLSKLQWIFNKTK